MHAFTKKEPNQKEKTEVEAIINAEVSVIKAKEAEIKVEKEEAAVEESEKLLLREGMEVSALLKEKTGTEVEITDAEAKDMKVSVAETEVKKSTEAEASAGGSMITETSAGVNNHKKVMKALICPGWISGKTAPCNSSMVGLSDPGGDCTGTLHLEWCAFWIVV